jgi:methylglutamate dehydrogenase subunit D
MGTVTDLSHGRVAIRVSGPEAEWVLAKFFALDFALEAFPGRGREGDGAS